MENFTSLDELWSLVYSDFVLEKNWVLDKSFFDDVYDSQQFFSKLRKTSLFDSNSSELKVPEKLSCYSTMKDVFGFPEFPQVKLIKHSTKAPDSTNADQTLNFSGNNLIASTPNRSQNSTKTGNQDFRNDHCEHVNVPTTTQPVPEVPQEPENLVPNKSNLVFLKNGQSNEINPQLALNLQPDLSVYKDLKDCVVNRSFESNGLDFSNFAWSKGDPETVTSNYLSDLKSEAKSRDLELSLDDPATIDETISKFDYFLKKWSGDIASRLLFLFPFDIPMDICAAVSGKFKSKYPHSSTCWQYLMKKFPQYQMNYSCFEVMFGRRIHERFRNRASTLRKQELFSPSMRSYKIEMNEANNKAVVSLDKSKSKKSTPNPTNNDGVDVQQLDLSGLPIRVEPESKEDSDDESHPLDSFDYNFAMREATAQIGEIEYTAPLIFITYLVQKNEIAIQAKEKKEDQEKAAAAKQILMERRKSTRTKKDQEVGLPPKKKMKQMKKK